MIYFFLNITTLILIFSFLYLVTRKGTPRAALPTLAIILVLTAIFDSLIIKSGIVGYDTKQLLGFYIWMAPIEDFAYAIASVALTASLWEYLNDKKQS